MVNKEFVIDNYLLTINNDDLEWILMSLFISNCNKGESGETLSYQLTTEELSDRLSALGFSYEKACEDFNTTYDKKQYFQYIDDDFIMRDYDFGHFIEMLKIIVKNGINYYDLDVGYNIDGMSDEDINFINYMMEKDYTNHTLGFPVSDIRFLIQILIHLVGKDKVVNYNIISIGGPEGDIYDTDFPKLARHHIGNRFRTIDKIIIITEGKSDASILKKGLEYLYPHMIDLYSFYDFDRTNSPGSTNEVVKTIKSFVSAGVVNKLIALLDNDTEGEETYRILKKLSLPQTAKVLKYPKYDKLVDYPTIGPQGIINMDVNGLAASIELYLDTRFLYDDDKLLPVQWTGYKKSINQYQGQVLNKNKIQKNFYDAYKTSKSSIDWEGIKLILDEVLFAFS